MSIFDNIQLEWWQGFLILLVLALSPLVKAIAVVIIGRTVKPKIAKVALPLIFKRPNLTRKKTDAAKPMNE